MFRDHEPDGATGRPAAILRYDKIAAARAGEPFDALQFRARPRLEARHGRRSFVGLCDSRHSGKEKGEQEEVLVGDSHGPGPSVWSSAHQGAP